MFIAIGVRAPLDLGGGGGGGGDLIARKKLHNARKHALYKHSQIAEKQKRSQFLRLKERIIISKFQFESQFFEPPRETKIGSKNLGKLKLQCSTEEREPTFVPRYREVRKNESSRDRDSTVVILKPCILYDLDRLPSKTC